MRFGENLNAYAEEPLLTEASAQHMGLSRGRMLIVSGFKFRIGGRSLARPESSSNKKGELQSSRKTQAHETTSPIAKAVV